MIINNYIPTNQESSSNLSGCKIQTGSYVGTGTYGLSSPNTLTFDIILHL